MRGARNFFLIAIAGLGLAATGASAQSLFNFPLTLPGSPPAPNPQTFLPPDADPNYSTPGGYDNEVDMARTTRKEVADPTGQPAGTLTINTRERKLYLSEGAGRCNMALASGGKGSPGRARPRLAESRFGPDGPLRRK
jgi:hypothetical protein